MPLDPLFYIACGLVAAFFFLVTRGVLGLPSELEGKNYVVWVIIFCLVVAFVVAGGG